MTTNKLPIDLSTLDPDQFRALLTQVEQLKPEMRRREEEARQTKLTVAVEQLNAARSERQKWEKALVAAIKEITALGGHQYLTSEDLRLVAPVAAVERRHTGRGRPARPVLCVETGETFVSVTAASRALGKSDAYVSSMIASHGGQRAVIHGKTYQYVVVQPPVQGEDEVAPAPVTPDPDAEPLPLPAELQHVGGIDKEAELPSVHHGMALRDALTAARALGLRIEHRTGTGEVTVWEPSGRPLQINSRRKDAPRELTHLLQTVLNEQTGQAA